MNDQPRKECCTCGHWVRGREAGLCHRNAPSPTVMIEGETYTLVWPKTGSNDHCGEWKGVEQ